MANLVVVHGVEINELFHRGFRVVTFEMASRVHGIPLKTVQNAYARNAEFFVEGEDTFLLQGEEFQVFKDLSLKTGLVISDHANQIRLFTEQGYYLLVKPMGDATSWHVQREMAKTYFHASHQIIQPPKPMSIPEQIDGIRDAYSLLEDFGLADDACRILARESIQSLIRMLGAPGGILPSHQIPQTTRLNERHFMIEDLRNEFPDFTAKFWLENRGAFGKAVKGNIQKVTPDCDPLKIFKDVNGSERQVNAWPMEYRELAIEAIRNYAKKLEAKVN